MRGQKTGISPAENLLSLGISISDYTDYLKAVWLDAAAGELELVRPFRALISDISPAFSTDVCKLFLPGLQIAGSVQTLPMERLWLIKCKSYMKFTHIFQFFQTVLMINLHKYATSDTPCPVMLFQIGSAQMGPKQVQLIYLQFWTVPMFKNEHYLPYPR